MLRRKLRRCDELDYLSVAHFHLDAGSTTLLSPKSRSANDRRRTPQDRQVCPKQRVGLKCQEPGKRHLQTAQLLPGVVTEPLPYHNSTSAAAGAGGEGAPAGPLPMDYSRGVQFFQRAALSLGAPLRPRMYKTGSRNTVNPKGLRSTRVAQVPISWQAREYQRIPGSIKALSHKSIEESRS